MEELKCFFSYTRTDSEFVLQLAKELRAVGANLWLDQLDIIPGDRWDRAVEEALRTCKGMIVVLSPESVASDNVMDEVSYALNEKKLVVPVLLRPCNIPFRLQRVQYSDFTTDYEAGFSQLLRALGIEQPAQVPESATAEEPVVQDSPAPLEAKPTEPAAEEAEAIQEVQEPSPPKVPEPALDVPDQPKSARPESDKIASKARIAKVLAAICIVALVAIVLTAVFPRYGQPKSHKLTVSALQGSVTKSPNRSRYDHGETIILEAEPDPGYGFTDWSGDLSGSRNPTTLVMDADKSVTASFALKGGNVTINSIGMKLVSIPAGSFMMGSGDSTTELATDYNKSEGYFADELPQHQVRISEVIWMGQTEVTQGQYESVMDDRPWSGQNNVEEDANNPATYVSWDDAVEFCRRLSRRENISYRLPTEAESEYACRAGTTTRFSFGNDGASLGDYAWFLDNTEKGRERYAHEVGQKIPNLWGLYDMHGNVFEWCSDFYDEDYYSNSPTVDPEGLGSGEARCLRGGSSGTTEAGLRCSSRSRLSPGRCDSIIGFRVVRSRSGPYVERAASLRDRLYPH